MIHTVNHHRREYWIKLESESNNKKTIGYLNDYNLSKSLLSDFQSKLDYEITDQIQNRLNTNKENRKRK
jgi:hypothetical protein